MLSDLFLSESDASLQIDRTIPETHAVYCFDGETLLPLEMKPPKN